MKAIPIPLQAIWYEVIKYKVAHLNEEKIQEVTDKIISIFVED